MNGKDNFLLDTNIILGFLNGHAKVNAFFQKHLVTQTLHVSQISRMELLGYSSITLEEEKYINHFLSLVKVLPISDIVCNEAITLRKKTRLKLPDALIAATAICYNLILITCDADLLVDIEKLQSISPA